MNDLEAIRLFLAVAEESGFARAARRLGISPAVATRKIAALERSLETRLFTRSTRHVALTQGGWLFRDHARRVIEASDLALEAMRESSARPSGRLRVLCRTGLGRHIVVPYLGEFRTRYPEVTLGLELTEDPVLGLRESGCDVGLMIGQLDDSSLVARRIVQTDSLLFASPDYLERHGTPRHPDELVEYDCLTIVADTGTTTWRFSRKGERFRVRIRAAIAVNDADALMSCALAGLGIGMLADWLAQDDLQRGTLVQVLPEYQVEPRGTPITALYPSRTYVPLKVRAFVDFLREKCEARFATRTV